MAAENKPKARKKHVPPTVEEIQKAAELEAELFGEEGLNGAEDENAEETDGWGIPTPWPSEDGAQAKAAQFERQATQASEHGQGHASTSQRAPVWQDDDDGAVQVNISGRNRLRKLRQQEDDAVLTGVEYAKRLRQQHSRMHTRTSWASLKTARRLKRDRGYGGDDDDNELGQDAEALLTGAGSLLGRSALLPPGLLETTRMKDANQHEPSKAVVQSVEFHSNGELLMTAGFDKRLRLFQVDGVRNPKLQSVFLEDLPISKADFMSNGAQVVAAGRRRFFYVYDLNAARIERVAGVLGTNDKSYESFEASKSLSDPLIAFFGNEGHVPLVSLRSRQTVGTLKMSGTVRSAAFSSDGSELLTSGSDGVVHTWDIGTRRCIRRDIDEGTLNGTSLACSHDDRLYATGSDSGVVNIYQRSHNSGSESISMTMPRPAVPLKPLKTLMNLTTTIDTLRFSTDTQMLAMASRLRKDSLRLVHLPSCTVFSNWPTSRTPLGHVHSLAFSPRGGFLAVGNAKGKVLLYRLHHYSEA